MDPTLHDLALALPLPLYPVREETLLEAIYLENWMISPWVDYSLLRDWWKGQVKGKGKNNSIM